MKLKLSEAVVSCCCCYSEGDQHFKGLRDKHINVCFCFKVHHRPFLALSFNLEPLEKTSNWSVAAEYDGQAVCPITFQTLHQTDVSEKSKGFLSWRLHSVRQATTAKSLISPRDLIHPVAQLWMMLIGRDAAALVKGRPLLQAVVFLPLTPAFAIISCRSRQSTASPLSFGLRRAAKLPDHLWQHALPRFPKCFRHRGGDTYTPSFFVFALQQRWNRISLIFLSLGCQSWPSSLQILPSVFSAWIVHATLPRIPGIKHSCSFCCVAAWCIVFTVHPPAPAPGLR